MKNAFYIIIAIFAASFAFASVQEGKELFEAKCGSCHSLERSLRITKGLMAWKRTIKRMDSYTRGRTSETEEEKTCRALANNLLDAGAKEILDEIYGTPHSAL